MGKHVMKECPFCGREIPVLALKCPHCHEDLTNKNNSDGDSPSGRLVTLLVVIVVLVSCILIATLR